MSSILYMLNPNAPMTISSRIDLSNFLRGRLGEILYTIHGDVFS